MLSDESSSDSETGRFKCRTKIQDERVSEKSRERSLQVSKDNLRSSGRRRYESERFRDFETRRDERVFGHHTKDRHRYSRHSPIRRRNSRERSKQRDLSERHRHERNSGEKSKYYRSDSRDRTQRSDSKTRRSPNKRKDVKEIIKSTITENKSDKAELKLEDKRSVSSENKRNKSEIHKPVHLDQSYQKCKSSPVDEVNIDSDVSEEVKPGSYYNMIPAIVKDKSEESSEIDSSDDERLRAKLLNLEKEINKNKKKKHKKKHKKKTSKSCKEKVQDNATSVEVSSTTDIQDNIINNKISTSETAEVTSTQKSGQKESSEEGEILSDDESQTNYDFDPNDLRHKLKRSIVQANDSEVCGPALPPHLTKKTSSPDKEGPALPPKSLKPRHLGPTIPQNIRKVLEEKSQEIIKFDSSDEDVSVVGPLPAGSVEKWTNAHKRLEERALDMKIKKLDGCSTKKVDIKSREQWMLKLPEGKTRYLGLEARTFRAKEGPDMSDRSSWTDTPDEKNRKAAGFMKDEDTDAALQKEAKLKKIANRDEEQDKAIRKHKKKHKRDESLLELHQKKLKKKKKKDEKNEEKTERRPFSRDIDLQVNRFDEAQKKSIIKKAQELDTRFSRGEAKYL